MHQVIIRVALSLIKQTLLLQISFDVKYLLTYNSHNVYNSMCISVYTTAISKVCVSLFYSVIGV